MHLPPDQDAEERDAAVADVLRSAPAYLQSLPSTERHIATMAANGHPVWEIAQDVGMSDQAVAHTIDRVFAAIVGRETSQVETGGFGSDTDPGVTGGYGDTGFGALDTEPIPDNTEPREGFNRD